MEITAPHVARRTLQLYPLSSLQQGIWLDQIASPHSTHYNIGMLVSIDGPLDVDLLEQAIKHIARLYDALRVVIHERSGIPEQSVMPRVDVTLMRLDLSGDAEGDSRAHAYLQKIYNSPFDLYGSPLWRSHIVRVSDTRHYWLQFYHHLIIDGVSTVLLCNHVIDCYHRLKHGDPLPTQSGRSCLESLAADQAYRESSRYQQDLAFWSDRFAELPPPLIGTTDPSSPHERSPSDQVLWSIDRSVMGRITAVSADLGLSVTQFMLALVCAYFARANQATEVILGLSVHNRGVARHKNTIGTFASVVPVAIPVDRTRSFADLMDVAAKELRSNYRHQRVSSMDLHRHLVLAKSGRQRIFDVLLSVQNFFKEPFFDAGTTARFSQPPHDARVPLGIHIHDWVQAHDVPVDFDYWTDALTRDAVERMRDRMKWIVDAVLNNPHIAIEDLPFVSQAESGKIVEFSQGRETQNRDGLIHELFESQVERLPGELAVAEGSHRLTYGELNERANQLAHYLLQQGAGPDRLVALFMERGIELVVGMLGALKAGAAYVPIDSGYPAQRVAQMIADAQPVVVITQGRLRGQLPDGVPVVALDAQREVLSTQPTSNIDSRTLQLTPRHLAYVLYTSGSTGAPKGVMVEHRSLVNYAVYAAERFDVANGSGSLIGTSLSFDLALTGFYPALICGRPLHLCDGQDLQALSRALLSGWNVAPLKMTPSHFTALQQVLPPGQLAGRVRTLVLGGEPIAHHAVEQWMKHASGTRVFNHYGPTEATVGCAVYEIEQPPSGPVPIGRPISNAKIYILDSRRRPVGIGVTGEIYIGGAGVARGYLNRADLTAERFVKDPFSADEFARMYRTGDLGRWRADGNVEFLGRNDHQVKIRGFRIELGEIEAALSSRAGVREVAVVAREDVPGEQRLVAYYSAGESDPGMEELRSHMKERLPEYMLPTAYVRLERLPLTSNGKLDRKALPAPDLSALSMQQYEAPQGEIEGALASIWQELLNIERVGRRDNFFELGGHSLLAVQLIERLRRSDIAATARDVFSTGNLAELAAVLHVHTAPAPVTPPNLIPAGCDAITPAMLTLIELEQQHIDRIVSTVPGGAANVQDLYPLAPLQEGIHFHHLLNDQGETYVLPILLRVESRDRLNAFLEALQAVIDRHDVLRTAILWDGLPRPLQAVHRKAALSVQELELDHRQDPVAQLTQRLGPEWLRMDLSRPPLIRAQIARDRETPHWYVLLYLHHLIIDHVTMEILLFDVMAYMEGRADQLGEPVPYREFVAYALQWAERDDAEKFFRAKLSDVDEPTLPFGLTDVHGDGGDIQEARLPVAPSVAKRVRRLAQELCVSAATLFHVAWSAVVAHGSARDDVVFGSILSGRLQGMSSAHQVLGNLLNTLPFRLRLGGRTVREMVRYTHEELTQLLEHEQTSLAVAQRCSGISGGGALFSAVLNYRHSAGRGRLLSEQAGHSSGIQVVAARTRNNYPLTLSVDDLGDNFALTALADTRVDAQRLTMYVHTALESLAHALQHAPATQMLDLKILPDQELDRLTCGFNATATAVARDGLIHELFESQVERLPGELAVAEGSHRLTYGELNERANQLAHYLLQQGAGPDRLVALFMERGIELVVGMLGALKAGAAYVPIDSGYPAQRVAQMIADAQPVVVITQGRLRGQLPDGVPVVALDAQREVLSTQPTSNIDSRTLQLTPRHLAYVLYTSGSTGAPKGVMVEHRSLVNYAVYAAERFDVANGSGSLIGTSLSFDLALTGFYPALICGRPLHLCDGQDLQALSRALLSGWNVAPLKMTPSHFTALQQVLPPGQLAGRVRTLVLGGEPIAHHAVEQWMKHASGTRVFNHYGPTEATVGCAVYEIEQPPSGPVPIGRPISNAKIYILDSRRRPVGIGVTGEIYIGGAGVARGYLNRADLTAERFVKDPFSADEFARMYRTGDLGRWRADGNVEFLGRNDHQVKIRGFRIELGEIEAALSSRAGVREVAVVAREDVPGEQRLVAYYSAGESDPGMEELRSHMKERLPEYMLPTAYVRLERLPLTSNGKLDRKALPAPDLSALSMQQYEAPQGEIEGALASIWQELLNVERVGRRDNFFELGGHSLLAVQLITRVRAALGLDLALRDLFTEPTIRELAKRLSGGASLLLEPIEKADRSEPLPLSHAQQRLWFVDRFEGAGAAYHIAGALRLEGQLDSRALRWALNALVQRHEILRTTFVQRDGNPVQVIAPTATFGLREIDLSTYTPAARDEAFEEHAAQIATARFDLSAGPLIRGHLLRYGDEEHVLLIAMHHIVSDGWSLGVLIKELGLLYSAAREGRPDPLPPLTIQYADHAVWQRNWLQREAVQTQLQFWREQLAGMPTLLELPADRPRPLVQSFRGGSIPVVVEEKLTAQLNELSRRHGVTLFMTLYSAYALLMSRLSGQSDIIIGSPLANRQREEVEPLIGFFVNTLPLRIRVDDDPSVRELLLRVKEMTLAAYGHQHVPFEQIVEAVQPPRSLGHSPVYQVSFTWGTMPNSHFTLPGLTLSRVEVPRDTSQIDLSLILREEGGRILGNVIYAGDLFDRSTVERWMRHFQTVLAQMLKDAEQPASRVALLGEQDRRCVIEEFNATAMTGVKELMVHELFEEHSSRDPTAIALAYEGQQVSYGELNRRANQLARYLRERGVQPDTLVAICMDRSVEMIVGLLGVLKAGAAYLPLDPGYPEGRLAYMQEDAGAPIVLTLQRMADALPVSTAQVIAIDSLQLDLKLRDDTNLSRALTGATPEHLAYIIYTSGSTGRPKGVMVEHRNLVNLIHWHCAAFDLRAGDRSSCIAGLGFDAAVWEIWTTLCAGATLVLPASSSTDNLETLLGWWQRQRLDVSFLPTPAAEFAFNRGIDSGSLKTLLVGGDQLRYRPPAASAYRLINNYGLTETTVVATSGYLEAAEATAHIGRPIANTQIYILDAYHQPVPIGVVGEIYVGGASVVRGYLNREELTAERFPHDPFSAAPAARMCKTGDLARWRADGNIEFFGRSDQQIKIRGYRIEPGEIESQLSRHPQVREAIVVVPEDEPGEKRLVAYVTYREPAPSADALRTHLKSSVPSHMIPAAFVLLQTLPLTSNGKVDRNALPAADSGAYALKQYEPPLGVTEVALAGIWQDLLRLERVGRHDSFFELGGHSLLAVQATARISQAFQIDTSLAEIFDSPSVASMAEVVVSRQVAQFDPADVARVSTQLAAATVA